MFNATNIGRLFSAFETPKPKLVIRLILSHNGLAWYSAPIVAKQRDKCSAAKAEGCEHPYHEELPAGMTPWLPYSSMADGVDCERKLEVLAVGVTTSI